jgi:hypothetical protein
MKTSEKIWTSFSGNIHQREGAHYPIYWYLVIAVSILGLLYKVYDKFW